ncbi:carbohydrate-binding protein [Acrocarpospora phusangensis]|uniref:Carbohydrate-binding protein n=1 Tax=Acrocarpospora phusangensis TaxID=1070424 RepID=A0A919Q4Q5_9ACTN|nr:extracellular solute-binding protein [Acrocarpospora phusangensis]GIH22319.1 carbohydrate-binding protein [Acrocarpospora phusangensis]
MNHDLKPPRPSRRAVLGALGALGAVALTGCGATGHTRIRYWNLFGGGDGVLMVKMQDEFRAAHPDIDLEAVTLAWGAPYYTKLAMASAGGRGPEVAIMHLARLPGFAPENLLDPFDEKLMAEVGLATSQFPPQLIERASVGGRLYALPLDTHPLVMYYNTDIAGKAGLLGADGRLTPITGEDQFIDALKKLKDVTGVYGLAVDNADVQPWRIFWSLYRQQDGPMELPIGGTVRMDDAKALKALTFMRRLTAEGLATVGVDYAGAVATFSEQRAGIHWNGDWEVATFTTAKLPFSMTGFPALYGNGRAEADSHSFVLPRQRDRDPAATRATYTFLAYLLKNSVTWGQAGHIPAYQPVATSPEYLALKPQSEYRDVVNDVQLDPPAWFSGSGSELENQAGVAFQAVLTGALTPEQGLAQFKGALNRLLTTPSPA